MLKFIGEYHVLKIVYVLIKLRKNKIENFHILVKILNYQYFYR